MVLHARKAVDLNFKAGSGSCARLVLHSKAAGVAAPVAAASAAATLTGFASMDRVYDLLFMFYGNSNSNSNSNSSSSNSNSNNDDDDNDY